MGGSSPFPPALKRLIENLCGLPGIGEKSATRLALAILRWPREKARELGESIIELHQRIGFCSICHTFSEEDPCSICGDPKRDPSIICIVEDPGDVAVIEGSGAFRGRYHVLHGVISPMEGVGPEQLKLQQLRQRVETEEIKEVVVATSSTAAGEATAHYISELLQGTGVQVSRIACGIPMGMDIKYADGLTLRRALESRSAI